MVGSGINWPTRLISLGASQKSLWNLDEGRTLIIQFLDFQGLIPVRYLHNALVILTWTSTDFFRLHSVLTGTDIGYIAKIGRCPSGLALCLVRVYIVL